LVNIGISVRFGQSACEAGGVSVIATVSPPRAGAVRTALRHFARTTTDAAVRIELGQVS
jgi:hypothetical protein